MGEQAVVGRDPGGRDNAMAIVMGDARREADELQPVAVQVDGDRGNRRTTLESQIDRRRGSRAADDIAILVRDRDREATYLVVGNDLLRHAAVLDNRTSVAQGPSGSVDRFRGAPGNKK